MSGWQAFWLGLVEGITEFLPVSSTGHLLMVQRWMGIPEGEAANAFAICIQAGAILAVLMLYPRRLLQVGQGALGQSPAGRSLLVALAVAFLPAAVIGLVFDDAIEAILFGPWPIIVAWFVGGVALLLWGSRLRPDLPGIVELEFISPRMAIWIGLAQCVAMWPGTSRSLMTIVAGVLVGLSLQAAVEFSFILGLLTLGAATAFKLLGHADLLMETYSASSLAIGLVTAWISAAIAVKWMVAYLQKRGLAVFGVWRVTGAIVAAGLLLSGLL